MLLGPLLLLELIGRLLELLIELLLEVPLEEGGLSLFGEEWIKPRLNQLFTAPDSDMRSLFVGAGG